MPRCHLRLERFSHKRTDRCSVGGRGMAELRPELASNFSDSIWNRRIGGGFYVRFCPNERSILRKTSKSTSVPASNMTNHFCRLPPWTLLGADFTHTTTLFWTDCSKNQAVNLLETVITRALTLDVHLFRLTTRFRFCANGAGLDLSSCVLFVGIWRATILTSTTTRGDGAR